MKILVSKVESLKKITESYVSVIAEAKASGDKKRIVAADALQRSIDSINKLLQLSVNWEKKKSLFKKREYYVVPDFYNGLVRDLRAYLGR